MTRQHRSSLWFHTFLLGLPLWLSGCGPATGKPVVISLLGVTGEEATNQPASVEVAAADQPALAVQPLEPPQPPPPPPPPPDPSIAFFKDGIVPRLKLEFTDEEAKHLRDDARKYALCKLIENGETTYTKVGVKLKGAAGSFRNFDDRPAFTLNLDRNKKGQKFHGLDKFHLNNSVQDGSYLSELICSEICQEAGLPAARTTHARVWINDRDMGVYVLKESFNKSFLKLHFKNPNGNLYDSGFLQDIDADLQKDSGENPDDRGDLKGLLAACREPDLTKRYQLIEERLDVPAFLNFVAFELMACHWDGYARNRNNYRIYFDPAAHKAHFFPHGMDQMFGDPNFNALEVPGAIVANTVLQNLEWRRMYRKRVEELLPFFKKEKLAKRVDELQDRLRPVFAEIHPDRAREFGDHVRGFKDRLMAREERLLAQLQHQEPLPLAFNDKGEAVIANWYPMKEIEDVKQEETEVAGKKLLRIQTGGSGQCVASWRSKVLLARGKYRLEARMQTKDVAARRDDSGLGAGVRISGGRREGGLEGTTDWQPVRFEFEIPEDQRQVELVAELRATKGELLIDREIKVLQVK